MVQVRDLTEITVRDLWAEVKEEEDWWGELKQETLRVVQRLVEGAMEGQMLEHLRAPRDREGHYRPTVLPRYQRRHAVAL